jgi:hypothetical protein
MPLASCHPGPGLAVEGPGGADVRILGIVFIVLGVIGFVLGGISWTQNETVVDAGPIQIQAEERKSIPLTPIASGIALVAGIALIATARRS